MGTRRKRKSTSKTTPRSAANANEGLSPAKRPKRARRRRSPGASSGHSAVARLDLLPTEVLQHIYLYGANLALPQVCARLYYALNAPMIQSKLLDTIFEWHCSGKTECRLQARNVLSYEPEQPDEVGPAHDLLSSVRQALIEQRRHGDGDTEQHSSLLQQHWLTYEMLRDGQWRHFRKLAQHQLRRFLIHETPSYVDAQLQELDLRLRSMLDWGFYSPFYIICKHWAGLDGFEECPKPLFSQRRDDGASWCMFLIHDWGLNSLCLIQIGTAGASSGRYQFEWHLCVYPLLMKRTELPVRLLRGPWTQQKGYLLDLVTRAITLHPSYDGDLLRQNYVDATDGLLEAIEARCIPAIYRLVDKEHVLDEFMPCFFSEASRNGAMLSYSHRCTDVRYRNDTQVSAHQVASDVGLPQSALRLDATGEWRMVHSPSSIDYPGQLTIRPEARHLEAQLQHGSPDDLGDSVFRFLTGATNPDVDGYKKILALIRKAKRMCMPTDTDRPLWLELQQSNYTTLLIYAQEGLIF